MKSLHSVSLPCWLSPGDRLRPALLRLAALMRLMAMLALGWGALAQGASGQAVVKTEQVRAELLAHAPEGVAPGRPVWVGLRLEHAPHWHTYWKNSGDSGLPTELRWTLPPGIQAGEIAWPVPKRLPLGTLVNFGYEGTVLLPVALTIGPEFAPPPLARELQVKLQASWLVCRLECIPQDGEFTLGLALQGATAVHREAFEAALKAQPQPIQAGRDSVIQVEDQGQGQALAVRVSGLPAALQGRKLEVFAEAAEVVNPSASWQQAWDGPVWTARLPVSARRSSSPTELALVLTHERAGWRVALPVRGQWAAAAVPAAVPDALQAALQANAEAAERARRAGGDGRGGATGAAGLALALAGALLGGLILNLMPCVFPVLAIKVLGFARHSGDVRGHRLSGLAYTAGVVLSLLALGAALLGLRAAGEGLGWGFHLQSPAVVAALAALFTLLGLNLAGLFEFSHWAPSALASLQARHPVLDAFLSGVLAVAVASPCTAPFMGASLGVAVTLPVPQALGIFAALGLGLALPYLAASMVPAVARALPQPGPWMEVLRRALAFPMFATVAWLVWVLGQQSGVDGAGALLAVLVGLSAVVWSLTLPGRLRRWVVPVFVAVLLGGVWVLGPMVVQPAQPQAPSLGAGTGGTMPSGPSSVADPQPGPGAATGTPSGAAGWERWSPEREAELLAQGRSVFVDFTAAWCVTCQYNKRTTLADATVLADFAQRGVVLLRADWTRRDPAITAALGALGRSGVPVYALLAPGRPPQVLSEILSVREVREALARLERMSP